MDVVRGILVAAVVLLGGNSLAWAENEGQADLDKAIELKLSAESLKDLAEVINLCRSALAAGLEETSQEFANSLLVGTLVQRAEIMASQIFDNPQPPAQWPLLRRQALLDLEEALKVDDQQFQVHYLLGRFHALPGGDNVRATKALDAALKLSTESIEDRAKCLVLRGTLASDEASRRADYDAAIELVPENTEILKTRGMYLLMQKEYDAALADIDKAIELDDEDADAHEARGVILFLTNKNDEALKSFDRVLELQPQSAMAHTHRARIFVIDEKPEEALAALDKALEIDERLVPAYVLRSRVRQQQEDNEGALEDIDEALRLAPRDAQARQMRALLLAGDGQLDRAISDLETLYRADNSNDELTLQLGLFYLADKRPDKAIDIFTKVLDRDGENLQALRNRGDAWLGSGNLPNAIADYEAALKLDDKDSGVLNNLAWLLATAPDESLRNGSRSVELAKEAARVTDFKEPHILSTLAAAYAESGDFTSAKSWSKKAVELAEKNEDSEDIREQLGKELASYEAEKPWREEIKPEINSDDPEPEELPEPSQDDK
jgi:tetratricopeptide (TPR) repeat protein